jgi:hypothetical protein
LGGCAVVQIDAVPVVLVGAIQREIHWRIFLVAVIEADNIFDAEAPGHIRVKELVRKLDASFAELVSMLLVERPHAVFECHGKIMANKNHIVERIAYFAAGKLVRGNMSRRRAWQIAF